MSFDRHHWKSPTPEERAEILEEREGIKSVNDGEAAFERLIKSREQAFRDQQEALGW